jgi:hypothetical protein
MSMTAQEAIQRLTDRPADYATPEALRTLANELSIDSPGKVTVLYSNFNKFLNGEDVIDGMIRQGDDIRAIDRTAFATFVESDAFQQATVKAFRLADLDQLKIPDTPANNFLYDGQTGVWAEGSARFVSATTGEVRLLVVDPREQSVWMQTEAELMQRTPGITHIDDVSKSVYLTIEQNALAQGATPAEAMAQVKNAQMAMSFWRTADLVKVGLDGKEIYVTDKFFAGSAIAGHNAPPDALILLNVAQNQVAQLTPDQLALLRDGGRTLELGAAATALDFAGKGLGVIGVMAAGFDAYYTASQANAAYAAGDQAHAQALMQDWAGRFFGGLAGGVAAAELASSALGPLMLTGPVGQVIAVGGILIVGALGGIAGALGGEAFVRDARPMLNNADALVKDFFVDFVGQQIDTAIASAQDSLHAASDLAAQTRSELLGRLDQLQTEAQTLFANLDRNADDLADQTSQTLSQLAQQFDSALQNTSDTLSHTADAALQSLSGWLNHSADWLSQQTSDAWQALQSTVEKLSIKDAEQAISQAISALIEHGGQSASEAFAAIKGQLDALLAPFGDAFSLAYDQVTAHLLDAAKASYAQALVAISPITLDLNGGGVQTTALNTSQTHFDYAGDSAFNTLQVWQDDNGNATVDSGELQNLANLGIQSISTAYTSSTSIDPSGNHHRQHGSFTRTDGSTAAADDVWSSPTPSPNAKTSCKVAVGNRNDFINAGDDTDKNSIKATLRNNYFLPDCLTVTEVDFFEVRSERLARLIGKHSSYCVIKSTSEMSNAVHHCTTSATSKRRSPRSHLLTNDCVARKRFARSICVKPDASRVVRNNERNA